MRSIMIRNWAVGAACVVGLSACHPISSCGIGPLSVGMPQDQAEQAGFDFTTPFDSSDLDACGNYESDQPNDDHLSGLGSDRKVDWVQTDNPGDMLENGLGPGSTYAEIKDVYGDAAKVYPPELVGGEPLGPNELVVSQYVPVVVIRQGANAITFELDPAGSVTKGRKLKDSAVAEFVKVGTWETRGDDEGCA